MSPECLSNYLIHLATENLIPRLKAPEIPIDGLLNIERRCLLAEYMEWKKFYDWKSNEEWLGGGYVSLHDRANFNLDLKDFLAISYSVGLLTEKTGNYKALIVALTDVRGNNDSLDLESLIIDMVESEISEEENVLNFGRFGELVDHIKNPKSKDHLKNLLYTQTSDLVMEEPDNALKLAEILISLKLLAEKVDYEIVEDLVEKYIKVCEYSQQFHLGNESEYKVFELTNQSELTDSLRLLLDFPFKDENNEKFKSLCNHYKPVKIEESKAPVEANSQIEKIKSVLYESTDWQNNNVDFIDSEEKIEFGKLIIPFDEKKGLMMRKGLIKNRNGQLIPVAIKSIIDSGTNKKVDEAFFMAKAQDNKAFLKLYGYYEDKSDNGNKRTNIVMELAKESLTDLIKNWAEINIITKKEQAYRYAEILIHGMHALNKKNISHRDLKPDNILITEDGSVKIADFDVSKTITRNEYGDTLRTMSTAFTGTRIFVSPEMWNVGNGVISAEGLNYNISDVYSLGLTILNMLTSYLIASWNNGVKLQDVIYEVIDQALKPLPGENDEKGENDENLRSLLRSMLTVDHNLRPSFEALTKTFVKEVSTNKEEFA